MGTVRIFHRLAPVRRGHLCKDLKETRELAMEIDICGKSVPGRGNSKHNGPEAGSMFGNLY